MATEKRLIDAVRHERVLRRFAEHLMEHGMVEGAEAVNTIIKGLVLEPTVDAVEVVRCKDCISGKGSTHKACPLYKRGLMKDDDYCSVGERRTDAN